MTIICNDDMRTVPHGALGRKREGFRYETCVECGDEWNISAPHGPCRYVCPVCCVRRGRREAGDNARKML